LSRRNKTPSSKSSPIFTSVDDVILPGRPLPLMEGRHFNTCWDVIYRVSRTDLQTLPPLWAVRSLKLEHFFFLFPKSVRQFFFSAFVSPFRLRPPLLRKTPRSRITLPSRGDPGLASSRSLFVKPPPLTPFSSHSGSPQLHVSRSSVSHLFPLCFFSSCANSLSPSAR